MRLNIDSDARTMLNRDHHSVITVRADQECSDSSCTEMISHPSITFKTPEESDGWRYEMFSIDGVTVYFDKTLETVPEVTIARDSDMQRDEIMLRGLETPRSRTNSKR